jgi:hypothetical protein
VGFLAVSACLLYSLWHGMPGMVVHNLRFVIAICLLLIGYRLTLAMLPKFAQKPFLSLHKALKRAVLSIWTWMWEKLKLVFS